MSKGWQKEWSWLRQLKVFNANQDSDQGLTLIECLVAIIVIGASLAIVTPAVVVAVATRVQSQRAEQAFQIAQSEVDRIKLILERGGDYTLNIAETDATVSAASEFETEVPAPDDISPTAYSTTLDSAKPIDVDSDGVNDFAVQIFRTAGSTVGTRPIAFDLGVRVYRAQSVDTKTQAELGTQQAQLRFTSGEGQAVTQPLAVIYTNLVKSDSSRSLCDYYNFLNSTGGSNVSTPSQC